MARNKKEMNQALQGIGNQFNNLDFQDPGSWPAIPRYAACLAVMAGVVVVMLLFVVGGVIDDLTTAQEQEEALKVEYKNKVEQAVNINTLTQQKKAVQQYVSMLEKQLPSESEMDALLSDITRAGLAHDLQLDVFRPNQVAVKDYYAELPISIKGEGSFDNIARFAMDVARLSRIVTLSNISISLKEDGKGSSEYLVLEATARTFRYLDESEIEMQRKAKKGGNQ